MRAELAWLTFWALVIGVAAIFVVIVYQDVQGLFPNLTP